MRYMIDTANVESIKRVMEFFPIEGVTTNPTLVAKENTDFLTLIGTIRDMLEGKKDFFVQVLSPDSDGMIKEGLAMRKFVGENYICKIPLTKDGLKTIRILKEDYNINSCATAIFSRQQALLAARAGAKYAAPYVNRLDNICSDGAELVGDVAAVFDHFDLPCEVISASFKNIQQVQTCAMNGCHVTTMKPELFDDLVKHPLTDVAIAGFASDWKAVYGDKKLTDFFAK